MWNSRFNYFDWRDRVGGKMAWGYGKCIWLTDKIARPDELVYISLCHSLTKTQTGLFYVRMHDCNSPCAYTAVKNIQYTIMTWMIHWLGRTSTFGPSLDTTFMEVKVTSHSMSGADRMRRSGVCSQSQWKSTLFWRVLNLFEYHWSSWLLWKWYSILLLHDWFQ